jgi:hypothetical protein
MTRLSVSEQEAGVSASEVFLLSEPSRTATPAGSNSAMAVSCGRDLNSMNNPKTSHSTPASSDAKSAIQREKQLPGETLGQYLHRTMNWGGGAKSGFETNLFASGTNGPKHAKAFEPTQEDLAKFMEMMRDRHR